MKKIYYVIFPMLSVIIWHLYFAYSQQTFNMEEWNPKIPGIAAFLMLCSGVFSVILAEHLNSKDD